MAIGINKKAWEKIGITAGWRIPSPVIKTAQSDIAANMQSFYESSQDLNPDGPDFAVDIRKDRVPLPMSVRRQINNGLQAIGTYHQSIPMGEIISILKSANVILIQEDGTHWEGFVLTAAECGSENAKPFRFELAFKTDSNARYLPCESMLVMSACRMPSGKIELVMYLS